jgi:hypothetical protein
MAGSRMQQWLPDEEENSKLLEVFSVNVRKFCANVFKVSHIYLIS